MFYIYILQSLITKKYYIGSCNNLGIRLERHNKGAVKSTKAFVPWKFVYKEVFNSRKEAIARERQLKSWKSRMMIEKLIKKHF